MSKPRTNLWQSIDQFCQWMKGKSKSAATQRHNLHRRLTLESLEGRQMMTVNMFVDAAKVLHIDGGKGNDTVQVDYLKQETELKVTYRTDGGKQRTQSFATKNIKAIEFQGGADNDTFTNNTKVACTAWGGAGNDTLTGGGGNDIIHGGNDKDKIYGGAGHDKLFGDLGTDELWGEDGNDWLDAGSASEKVHGGKGDNWNAYGWAVNGTKATDIDQDSGPTCVILSALAAAADKGIDLTSRITYLGDYKYQVSLFDQACDKWVKVDVKFDGSIVRHYGLSMDPYSAETNRTTDCQESWTILYQRAYVKHFVKIDPLDGAVMATSKKLGEPNGARALAAITGWESDGGAFEATAKDLKEALDDGHIMTAMGVAEGKKEGHAYALTKVFQGEDGKWMVKLYNPWGQDTTHDSIPYEKDTNNNGYITMKYKDFEKYFPALSIAYKS